MGDGGTVTTGGLLGGIGITELDGVGVGVLVVVVPPPDVGVGVGVPVTCDVSGVSCGSSLGGGVSVMLPLCPVQYEVGLWPVLKYSVIVVQPADASLPVAEQTSAASTVDGISKSFAGRFLLIWSMTFFHTGIQG